MRKLIILGISIAALAIPATALATVAVDASGNGFVGKGDVQTALGYKTDAPFQAANPASATFTINGDRNPSEVVVRHHEGVAEHSILIWSDYI